jgi:hypothetical protein
MEHLKAQIKELAAKYSNDNIGNRCHLHSHPELSYQEFETAKFVKQGWLNMALLAKAVIKAGSLTHPNNRIARIAESCPSLFYYREGNIWITVSL